MYAQFAKERLQNPVIISTGAPGQAGGTAPNATATPAVKAKKPIRSVTTYLDRITIAGLHNYLYARGKYEKITWNITFFLAIVGTVYYLVRPIQEYLKSTIVLDIQYQTDPGLRLPNPWVCHLAVNVTYIREQFEKVKPELEADKRIQLLAQRYQKRFHETTATTVDKLIEVALSMILTVPVWAEETNWKTDDYRSQTAFEFISKVIRAMGSNWTGLHAFYEIGMFTCETILTKCTLNGMAFDCCSDGPMGYGQTMDKCFALDIRGQVHDRQLQRNQSKQIELQFETIIFNPSSELFSVDTEKLHTTVSFGNRADTLFDYSQALQGGSDSVIGVKGTKKEKLLGANCMESYVYRPQLHIRTHPIIRKYFEEMVDPNRYSVGACQLGKLFEVLFHSCGCVPYFDSMRPQNDTDICTPAHLHNCVYRAFQNDLPTNANKNESSKPTVEDVVKRDMFHKIKESMGAECQQLCESWIYDYAVFSTNIEDLEGNTSSINRTKVTIVFDPEYRVETEVYKMDPDTFIASLGDAFGLILGFSAVTLIQLPIWSIAAYMFKRKQHKISPIMGKLGIALVQAPGPK